MVASMLTGFCGLLMKKLLDCISHHKLLPDYQAQDEIWCPLSRPVARFGVAASSRWTICIRDVSVAAFFRYGLQASVA